MDSSRILVAGGALLLTACAAAEDPIVDSPDPSGTGGSATTTTSGMGGEGVGGTGQGGAGGQSTGSCDQDCSQIETPPCFTAVCNTGMFPGPIDSCVVVPSEEGLACDDGAFCTLGDACDGTGQCVGETPNDCGLTPAACEAVVCDEDNDTCNTEAAPNGDPCDSGNLCIVGATCINGLCQGGNPESCFLEPVPNECYVSVCNPANGQCEPIVGNDAQPCTDLNDLCTSGKICNNGACVGGQPKDCSGAAGDCEVDACDMATGQCFGAPGAAGDPCTSAADECNAGSCDANGTCQPVPTPNISCASAVDECNAGNCDASGVCQPVPTPNVSCASAADECNAGNCDASGVCQPVPTPNVSCASAADECNTGNCDASGVCQAVPTPGASCPSATDQCNAGLCDGSGVCQAQPLADGTTCNDADACTATDECTGGTCSGTQITACVAGDGCCPSGCDATTDIDCAVCASDFDDGTLQGWTVVADCAPQVTWQPDTFQFQAGTHSLYYGDIVARNYACSGVANSGSATSKVINLQPGSPQVEFWVWIETEGGNFDQLGLWVMPNDVQVWDRNDFPQGSLGETNDAFVQQTVDLSAYAGQSIQLQFRFDTIDSIGNSEEGVYIDSIIADGNCP